MKERKKKKNHPNIVVVGTGERGSKEMGVG